MSAPISRQILQSKKSHFMFSYMGVIAEYPATRIQLLKTVATSSLTIKHFENDSYTVTQLSLHGSFVYSMENTQLNI